MSNQREPGRGIRTEHNTDEPEYTEAQLELIRNLQRNFDSTLYLLGLDADRPPGRGLRSAYTNKLDERYPHA